MSAGTEHTWSLGIRFVVGTELLDCGADFRSDGRMVSRIGAFHLLVSNQNATVSRML